MEKLLALLKDKEKMKHYILYIVFGVLTTVVDFVTFYLLTKFAPSINENISNAIGIFVSIVFAYFTNRKYVFKSNEKNLIKEFAKFFLSRMASTLFNVIAFWILTTYTTISNMLAKLIISVVVVILNYIISKFYVFKEKTEKKNKEENVKEKSIKKNFFVILFFILIFTFSYFGMRYFPTVDDNNQLGVYHLRSDNIYENVINHYKSYDVRPFAFLTDAYIFSWFWDNMYALMAIMVVLHILNVYLLYKICEKIDIKLNIFFLITFSLSPILIEAVYWISASTRIVLSLFLILLSIYLLLLSFDEENKSKKLIEFIGAIIINFISVGFYEQTIALNLFLFIFVLICIKKYKYIFIPALSTTWIGIYYAYFMALGKTQERGTLHLSSIFSNILNSGRLIIKKYLGIVYHTAINLLEGFKTALENPIALSALIILLGVIIYYMLKKCDSTVDKSKRKILFGIMIFIVPFLPFFVLDVNIISDRNLYLSFIGICIILEVIFDAILKNAKKTKLVFVVVILILSVFSNIDKVNNYKKVSELDDYATNNLINAIDEKVIDEKKTISINYNVEDLEKARNTTRHVTSALEVDWGMQGKIQVLRNKVGIGKIFINTNQDDADCTVYFNNKFEVDKVIYK